MSKFFVRCSKCENIREGDAESPFEFISASRDAGWQVPDALENQPILCPDCKKTTNFPTTLGRTP